MMRNKDKQISHLLEGQQKFMHQQEEGQMKYISMLEKIAMCVLKDKMEGI
jgi:hypothetical protein